MSKEDKRAVWKKKKILKGSKIWIEREEDLTLKERKMSWKLREIVKGEREKGKKVRVERDRIRIDGE